MWKFRIGDRLEWAGKDFDDSRWESIRVPNQWEDEGFNGYDGIRLVQDDIRWKYVEK